MFKFLSILIALLKGQALVFPSLNTSLIRVYGSVHLRGNRRNILFGRRTVFLGRTTLICDTCARTAQIRIGDSVIFEDNTYINAHHGNISIGNNVFIGVGSVIQGMGGVTLGDEILIGPYVQVYSSDHQVNTLGVSRRLVSEVATPVNIGRNVWIGAGSVILRGTVIAANSVIAAGSVVRTKSSVAAVFAKRENLASQIKNII